MFCLSFFVLFLQNTDIPFHIWMRIKKNRCFSKNIFKKKVLIPNLYRKKEGKGSTLIYVEKEEKWDRINTSLLFTKTILQIKKKLIKSDIKKFI